jgi:glucose-6-phosphate 1-dehydrogenase
MATQSDALVLFGAVEAEWRVVTSLLGDVTPLYEYQPRTWGPAEAGRIIDASGGWHEPEPRRPS